MTSVTAVLGLVVHHQATQLKQAYAVVSTQARRIQQVIAAHPYANSISFDGDGDGDGGGGDGMTGNGRDARTGQSASGFQVSLGDAGVS
jgi:hypothetical protein